MRIGGRRVEDVLWEAEVEVEVRRMAEGKKKGTGREKKG